jgi:hypothetical protein
LTLIVCLTHFALVLTADALASWEEVAIVAGQTGILVGGRTGFAVHVAAQAGGTREEVARLARAASFGCLHAVFTWGWTARTLLGVLNWGLEI